MASVMTMGAASGKPRRKRRARTSFSCKRGEDSKRVKVGKGCTQELACTHKGATGWTYVKGTRRCSR